MSKIQVKFRTAWNQSQWEPGCELTSFSSQSHKPRKPHSRKSRVCALPSLGRETAALSPRPSLFLITWLISVVSLLRTVLIYSHASLPRSPEASSNTPQEHQCHTSKQKLSLPVISCRINSNRLTISSVSLSPTKEQKVSLGLCLPSIASTLFR